MTLLLLNKKTGKIERKMNLNVKYAFAISKKAKLVDIIVENAESQYVILASKIAEGFLKKTQKSTKFVIGVTSKFAIHFLMKS